MERLTYRSKPEMIEDGMITPAYSDYSPRKIIERLAEYEDAEEQGLFLRLPCKVGDTVYIIGGKYRAGKYEKWINEGKFNISDFEKLGKTVFLTPEEATDALQKMKEQSE